MVADFKAIGASLKKRLHHDESAPHVPTHIHLRGAVITAGSGKLEAPLWRGKLASVDGFSLATKRDEESA